MESLVLSAEWREVMRIALHSLYVPVSFFAFVVAGIFFNRLLMLRRRGKKQWPEYYLLAGIVIAFTFFAIDQAWWGYARISDNYIMVSNLHWPIIVFRLGACCGIYYHLLMWARATNRPRIAHAAVAVFLALWATIYAVLWF